MKKILLTSLLVSATFVSPAFAFDENDAKKVYDDRIASWATAPTVISAIKAQNEQTADYDQAKIDELDKKWQSDDATIIDPVINNDLSKELKSVVDTSNSYFAEIFVMDAKGLNVGTSAKTSDYWQGDEAKWQKTFQVGAGSVDIGDVKFDESSQSYTRQLSFPVMDGETPIGAVTVSINADFLPE
ncbi:MAG: hypothetical protein AUJ12_10030 [Alphaproteobacteria bacterium CG1_02_46_17]|nr:MAG: hypothetical protein AUJ12_10030 [Alphaproteobacteria bacterium CG1_02_46_17]